MKIFLLVSFPSPADGVALAGQMIGVSVLQKIYDKTSVPIEAWK